MKERLQNFMSGRYGNDQLNQFLMVTALICMVLRMITGFYIFNYIAIAEIIYCYVRMLSRDVDKRYNQNMAFLGKWDGFLNIFRKRKYYAGQRKDFHIYTCPTCKQKIRIPRGKGRISITCPKCKSEFVKKS